MKIKARIVPVDYNLQIRYVDFLNSIYIGNLGQDSGQGKLDHII